MRNVEIVNANDALSQLMDVPVKGKLKFKIFKNKSKLENAVEVIVSTLQGLDDEEERKDVLREKQEINIDFFTEAELEDIELTMKQLAGLRPIITFDEEEK